MRISVAGIGASAGGLEAFRLLLAQLPVKTGLAFVFVQYSFVQHLHPQHQRHLTEILCEVSALPVLQATDGMKIEPDHLYVMPSDAGLEIVNQTFKAVSHASNHMPIDSVMGSLAQEYGRRAVGVLLSGAGTDGVSGLEALKAAGGVTFAQDPATAKFSLMPQTAIARGCVDFVLSPEDIAAELSRMAGQDIDKVLLEGMRERRKRAEESLQESEERFRSMADTAPVLIWVSGPDKACTFFNKPWLAFTGRTMQQELGDGWADGVHREDLKRCLEIYTSSFDARRSFRMEYRLRRADGEYRWMLDNGVPRFEHGGVFVGYIGSCVDINDVKTIQQEDLAKQKLETIGALAGGIAHDFNNLLGGILAHSELALAELASGSSPSEELQRIRAGAIRGAEIVRQLMIYAGQESEVIELVDVGAIVGDMLELLQVSVSKHVKVETGFGPNLPFVRASPAQIRQVAMNLITNASEAIGDRDGVIRVTAGRVTFHRDSSQAGLELVTDGAECLQLEVSDSGRGMSPETQARVFDPFFTTKVSGTHGQGLGIVQRIVQSLHGAVKILSAPGKGTTFRILLPADSETAQATYSTLSRADEEALASQEATILVVDDEDLLRHAVSKMLRKKGLLVIEARDGFGALDVIRAQKGHIDVLLLDVTLPGAPSREVYQEAKRLRPDMSVIITSAKPEEMAAASLSASIERFLRKPFRLGDLLGTIREVLPS